MFVLGVLSIGNTSVPVHPTVLGNRTGSKSLPVYERPALKRFGGSRGGGREERCRAQQGPLEVADTDPHKGTWSVKLGLELFPVEARDLGFPSPIPVHQWPTGLPGVVAGGVNFWAGFPF